MLKLQKKSRKKIFFWVLKLHENLLYCCSYHRPHDWKLPHGNSFHHKQQFVESTLTSIIEIRKCPRCLRKDFPSIRIINTTNSRSYIFSHSSIRIQRDETWKKFRIFIFIHPKKIHTDKSNFSTFGLKWKFLLQMCF